MKVICAGFPKTGTTSLADALITLGYVVHDYREHITIDLDKWVAILERSSDEQLDFPTMYRGVDAVIDHPPCLFVKELMAAFPDAKVILSVRDNENQWQMSYERHFRPPRNTFTGIKAILFGFIPRYVISFFSPTMRKFLFRLEYPIHIATVGTLDFRDADLMKTKYREHNEEIQQLVTKDKLLVMNVKQGWKPLCDFLGCDTPDIPFPHKNKQGQEIFQLVYTWPIGRTSHREALKTFALISMPPLLALTIAYLYK